MPQVIPAYGNANITVVYNSVEQTSFEGTMNIYSNDPDLRLKTVAISGSRFAPNYVAMRTPKTYVGENAKVEVDLNVYDAVSGLQFDLVYPSQYYETFEDNAVVADRAQGMTVTYREIDDQTVRYFCYLLNGQDIPSGNGQLMTILLRPKNDGVPEGTYQVAMKNVKIGTSELADKYAGTDLSSTFLVKQSTATITAKSYTRVYGDANPEFEYTAEGETIVGEPIISCEVSATSPVGEYPIVVVQGSIENEDVRYVNGTLTITKAPLTITAGTCTKKQYDPMPEFSVSYEGFKNNETEAVLTKQVVISCDANADSAPGEYDITLSGAEAANYDIKYVAGKLTVTEPDSFILTYMIDDKVYKKVTYKYREPIIPEPIPAGDYVTFEWIDLPETMPAHDVVVHASYTTGIKEIILAKPQDVQFYSPNGKKLKKLQKGLNLVMMKDGTIKKIVVK